MEMTSFSFATIITQFITYSPIVSESFCNYIQVTGFSLVVIFKLFTTQSRKIWELQEYWVSVSLQAMLNVKKIQS